MLAAAAALPLVSRGAAAQQGAQRPRAAGVDREGGAQHPVDVLRTREHLLVDAREREERSRLDNSADLEHLVAEVDRVWAALVGRLAGSS